MFKNLKISRKLTIGFGVVVLILCGVSFYASMSFGNAQESTNTSVTELNNGTLMVEKEVDHLKWMAELSDVFLDENVTTVSVQTDPTKCKLGVWLNDPMTKALAAEDPELARLFHEIDEPHRHLHETAVRIGRSFSDNQPEQAKAIFTNDTRPAVESTQEVLMKIRSHFDERSQASVDGMHGDLDTAATVLIILGVAGLLIGIAAGFVISRSITGPIRKVVAATEQMNNEFSLMEKAVESIANNDLTVTIPESNFETLGINSQDEIGILVSAIENTLSSKDRMSISLRKMTANLNNICRQLADNARELVSAATEIASSSEQLSRGAEDQSNQVSQISAAVEQMAATVVESSKNAGDASQAATKANETAAQGGEIVTNTISGMQRIAQTVRESADSIGKLARSADQIGEIIGVIDDIADQTNLLALNAAIEAARAGEQGRGFAVVADEVRKLAERTGKATGEITDMIKGIQTDTSTAVSSMESGLKEVEAGRSLTDRAGDSLHQIVEMSDQVLEMIRQIATASEQQSSAAEQISKNIEYIATVTRESASGASQAAAAAEELNQQAEGMRKMVSAFRLSGGNTGIIELAKQDHRLYVKKLDAVIKRPETAGTWKRVDHHTCRFGKWYYSEESREYRGDEAFIAVEPPHIKVHEFANKAVDLAAAGKLAEASEARDKAHQASDLVMKALDELAAHINSLANSR